ncbi:MAG: hypothetical protein GZ091_08710 [Paludibacter sp.]|nr:hypothetical protein [Paludibacter sp.]
MDLWHGVTEPLMLCGAEVGEMKQTNVVKGIGLRYENRSWKVMREVNEPTASTWK